MRPQRLTGARRRRALRAPAALPVSIDPDRSRSWFRRVLPIARAHWWVFAWAIGLSLIGLVLQVAIPSVLNRAVNELSTGQSEGIAADVWLIVGLAVGAALTGVASRYLQLVATYDVEFDLRNITFSHLSRLSATFYDRVQSGDLLSRANSDIRAVQMFLSMAPQVIVQLAMAVVAFGFMLAIDVPLAIVAMATLPFTFLIGQRMRRVMYPLAWLIQSRLSVISSQVEENVSGVAVVKSFGAEARSAARLERASASLEWAQIAEADQRAKWMPLIQSLPSVGLLLVLVLGAYFSLNAGLQPGVILAFSAYLVLLQAPFMMLGQLIMLGQRAGASAGRIFEVLDEVPAIIERPVATDLVLSRGTVRFEAVWFGYGTASPVLHDLDFSVAPGETVAIVGRTGSGKSTIGRLLTRTYDVDAGAVHLDGVDVREVTLASLRRAVGVVTDDAFLFSDTIAANIALARPDAPRSDIEQAARHAEAHDFILALPDGYDTIIGERGSSLSGGQRQRLSIARSLLANPPVLVLDDATSAIDASTEAAVHRALHRLLSTRTTVIIAHRPSTIGLADRVLVLDGGRIVATGTHAELLAGSEVYRTILAVAETDMGVEPAAEPVASIR